MSERRPGRSRYDRPRKMVSWLALLIGITAGIGGGLFVAWNVSPIEEFNTLPWQLRAEDRAHYVVALMLAYAYDGDLERTMDGLLEDLRLVPDPFEQVANIACELTQTGYVSDASTERAVLSLMDFYQNQGRSGCADDFILVIDEPDEVPTLVAATPTLRPPPTKTPTPEQQAGPSPSPTIRVVPTVIPRTSFSLVLLESFCDTAISGVIEVRVQERDGSGIPGQLVRVSWDDGESVFMTGLMPERGSDYADFQMEPNRGYTIELPGLSDPSTRQIASVPCTTAAGTDSIQSYRAIFRPSF